MVRALSSQVAAAIRSLLLLSPFCRGITTVRRNIKTAFSLPYIPLAVLCGPAGRSASRESLVKLYGVLDWVLQRGLIGQFFCPISFPL